MHRSTPIWGAISCVLMGCPAPAPSAADGALPDAGRLADAAVADRTAVDVASGDAADDAARADAARPRVWGVTLDRVDQLPAVVESLSRLARRPTARIVFDEFVPAADYVDAASQIHAVADVMGEILDSQYVDLYTVAEYRDRTVEYLAALASAVDIWEVGNEINGEWLGTTSDVVAKMSAAFAEVTARGLRTALTLYYNEECWSDPANEVFTWAAANVPVNMKQGLDYVFFSYYEDDCNGLQPDWPTQFARLAALFPNSAIGFGECGTTTTAAKSEYVTRYYSMTSDQPRYVGGYFWWYYWQDMVPYTQQLWSVLDDVIAAQ